MVDVEVTANTADQGHQNTPFTIRRARAGADMQAVGKLWQQLVEYHNALDVQLPNAAEGGAGRYAARVESHLHDPGACVLVAEWDDRVIGFVLGVIVDLAPEMFQQERSGFLADIFVEAAHRRNGVGRMLVYTLAEWFRQQNVNYFEWHVAAQNPAALAFWQSVGGQSLMIRMRATLPLVDTENVRYERLPTQPAFGHTRPNRKIRGAGGYVTELLYQKDSYLRQFSATVTGVDEGLRGVLFDRTAFYPGGGGQPHDTGTITVGHVIYPVVRVERGNVHVLSGDAPLPAIGAEVQGDIDWERRYRLMRTHTAMHILCGVVWRDYGAQVTGGNMEPLTGRMDFEFERMGKELVSEIEARINAEVAAAREVRVQILPRAQAFAIPDLIRTKINLLPEGIAEVRTVEIVGLDLQADGGTHVANTREVGTLRISDYKSKGGINKRIYLEIGDEGGK